MKFIEVDHTPDGNYRQLKEKYLRGHQSRKKLALLEMERQKWCKEIHNAD